MAQRKTPPGNATQGQRWAEQSKAEPVPVAPPGSQSNPGSPSAPPALQAPVIFVGKGGQTITQDYAITFNPQLLQRLRQEQGEC